MIVSFPWDVLSAGDNVAVIAPSGPVEVHALARGLDVLRSWGLVPILGEAFERSQTDNSMFAAPDEFRARDVNWALTDPSIRAVLVARGGYGLVRILDALNWERVRESQPRPVVGLSDATCLHAALRVHAGWPSLMGPHVAGGVGAERPDVMSNNSLRNALFERRFDAVGLMADAVVERVGVAGAPVHGGNLAMLSAMVGSVEGAAPNAPFIAALEDINEAPYRVDRMLTQLLRAGWFANCVGVVCGSWKGCGEVMPVLRERLSTIPGPLVFDAAFGHDERHLAVPLGVPIRLDATQSHPVIGSC
jgi:muramoyltetrapeptide carboxypeptidase